MSKNLNPNRYKEAVKAIYNEALQAAGMDGGYRTQT